jgi:hypothetical protein
VSKYWPRTNEELAEDPIPVSFINRRPLPDNVTTLVPSQQQPLRAVIAQTLKDVEGLIDWLDTGVAVADSGRELIRELYLQARKQREILSAVQRLELE